MGFGHRCQGQRGHRAGVSGPCFSPPPHTSHIHSAGISCHPPCACPMLGAPAWWHMRALLSSRPPTHPGLSELPHLTSLSRNRLDVISRVPSSCQMPPLSFSLPGGTQDLLPVSSSLPQYGLRRQMAGPGSWGCCSLGPSLGQGTRQAQAGCEALSERKGRGMLSAATAVLPAWA